MELIRGQWYYFMTPDQKAEFEEVAAMLGDEYASLIGVGIEYEGNYIIPTEYLNDTMIEELVGYGLLGSFNYMYSNRVIGY